MKSDCIYCNSDSGFCSLEDLPLDSLDRCTFGYTHCCDYYIRRPSKLLVVDRTDEYIDFLTGGSLASENLSNCT